MSNNRYKPSCAAIGSYDGVHKGHQYMISRLREDANSNGLASMVITFRQHPQQVLRKDFTPILLSTEKHKEELLRATGVDEVVMLDFTIEMSQMTAREFMEYMHAELNVQRLLIGYDHRFGHNRSEGFEDYRHYGEELGIEVIRNDAFSESGINISSSAIRQLLTDGDIGTANEYLGYEYGFSGIIIHGYGEGRKLGFPTANMETAKEQLIPKRGVYAVRVKVPGYSNDFIGMMNIGKRPTYGEFKETHEVNIFNFDNDIYGKEIYVSFLKRIRDEKKFTSVDDLKNQLRHDKEEIENTTTL